MAYASSRCHCPASLYLHGVHEKPNTFCEYAFSGESLGFELIFSTQYSTAMRPIKRPTEYRMVMVGTYGLRSVRKSYIELMGVV